MANTLQIILLMALMNLISCRPQQDLPTVETVDLNRYVGLWYEIARLPNKFEKGLDCITAEYALLPDGKVTVLNSGKGVDGWESAKGSARVPDPNFPGRLKVSFFKPFWAPYWIIDLDQDNYQYVLIGTPSRKYLWIMSRNPTMDESTYNRLVSSAKSLGFDTGILIRPVQNCVQQ